jgi:hypothetical protein
MYENDTVNSGTAAENRIIVHLNCLNFVGRRVLFLEGGAMLSRAGESLSEFDGVLHADSVRSLFPISIFADDSEVCGAVFVDAKEGSMLEKAIEQRKGGKYFLREQRRFVEGRSHEHALYKQWYVPSLRTVCEQFANKWWPS